MVTGLGHASFPAVQVQGTHAPGGSPTVGVKTEPVNRGMRPAPGAAPSAGMLVPDICRAPTACAFNIVGPFSQGPGAKPPCSGPASSSAVDGERGDHPAKFAHWSISAPGFANSQDCCCTCDKPGVKGYVYVHDVPHYVHDVPHAGCVALPTCCV